MTESTFGTLLNECEREPLASSGLIQNEGSLLHVRRGSGLIDFVSDNIAAFIGDEPADLLGADGNAWIRDFLPDVSDLPAAAGRRLALERALDLGFGELDVLISATATGWLIELEPSREPLVDPASIHFQVPTRSRSTPLPWPSRSRTWSIAWRGRLVTTGSCSTNSRRTGPARCWPSG